MCSLVGRPKMSDVFRLLRELEERFAVLVCEYTEMESLSLARKAAICLEMVEWLEADTKRLWDG